MIEFPDRVNSSAVLESLDCQRQVNFQCTGGCLHLEYLLLQFQSFLKRKAFIS